MYGSEFPFSASIQKMIYKRRRAILILIGLVAVMWFIRAKGSPQEDRAYHFFSVPSEPHLMQEISLLKQHIGRLRKSTALCEAFKEESIDPSMPTIYAITPTHTRDVQKAELTRLSHTFLLVPNFHWIIVEDSKSKTPLVSRLLASSGLKYTHLNAPTPDDWKLKEKEPNWRKPRGVIQRNAALKWIHENLNQKHHRGVVYFADDDNTYGLELFEEMRSTQTVSVWPVGLVGGLKVEKPLVNSEGKVVGWNSLYKPERSFPIDMAGFAINLKLLLQHPEVKFSFEVENGHQESELLRQLATRDILEAKASNCTKVFVWHTRTEPPKLREEERNRKAGRPPSNLGLEV